MHQCVAACQRNLVHHTGTCAQVRAAVQGLTTFKHPLVLMPFSQFERCGKLESYEHARNFGRLVTFDTWDLAIDFSKNNTVVFFSHQWCVPSPCQLQPRLAFD